jgi:hypothetical protein
MVKVAFVLLILLLLLIFMRHDTNKPASAIHALPLLLLLSCTVPQTS